MNSPSVFSSSDVTHAQMKLDLEKHNLELEKLNLELEMLDLEGEELAAKRKALEAEIIRANEVPSKSKDEYGR